MKFTDIDWIFFDVGGVLLDDTEAEHRRTHLLLDICQKYDSSLDAEAIIRTRRIASAEIGSVEEHVIRSLVHDRTLQKAAQEEFKKRKKEIGYDQHSSVRLDAIDVARQLSQKYKLGLMANQPIHRTKQLEEHGLMRFFHHSEMSENYGFHKPDPCLFEEVFQETGAIPARSIMIDDNIERGLIPAKAFGMKTIWFRRERRQEIPPHVDASIESLSELLDLL